MPSARRSRKRRPRSKKKVALVCAGGGITGAVYEIGCLRALDELLDRLVEDHGLGLLLISHDLAVVRHVSDRIAVMFDGHIMGERLPSETNENELGLLMAGVTEGAA